MSEQKKEFAFPVVCQDLSKFQVFEPGMSLRDYYIGQALIGLLASWCVHPTEIDRRSEQQIAEQAIRIADFTMQARKS